MSGIVITLNFIFAFQEDKPVNYPILRFEIFDFDAPPNGRPFTFDFVSGNEDGLFTISQDAILKTNAVFSQIHSAKEYHLIVRVFDNGTKPLYSDTKIYIKVILLTSGLLPGPAEIFVFNFRLTSLATMIHCVCGAKQNSRRSRWLYLITL